MKNQKTKFAYFLIAITFIFGCKEVVNYNMKGNWSMVTSDRYYEIKIKDSTIKTYNDNFEFWYTEKEYKIKNDTFLLNKSKNNIYENEYLINKINDFIYILETNNDTIFLIKRKESDLTFDKITDSLTNHQFQKNFNQRLINILDSMKIKPPRLNRMLYDQ
ncbi:MAG: hypothetical protein ACI8WT_004273 [Clostridium sp.]|jgi:hypothetical protein